MLAKLIIKELKQELRSKDIIISMLIFSISITLSFQFIFSISSFNDRNIVVSLIWLVYIFSSILGLYKIVNSEREMGGFTILLSSPIERGLIYLAKLISFFIFIVIIQIISLPIFILFYNINIDNIGILSLFPFLVNNWALAAAGILISAIGYQTRAGEIVIPIIFFPIISPILIASSKISLSIMNGEQISDYSFWVLISVTFCLIFTAAGYILFDYICEE